jgi:hypothetical protein
MKTSRHVDAVKEEDSENEADEEYRSKRHLAEGFTTTPMDYPLRQRSTCHAEVLLVSLSELVPLIEEKIGYKCEEAFLEDGALRLIKASFFTKNC